MWLDINGYKLVTYYRQPNTPETIDNITALEPPELCLILGDLNARYPDWEPGTSILHGGQIIADWATRGGNTPGGARYRHTPIEHTFCRKPGNRRTSDTLRPLPTSDCTALEATCESAGRQPKNKDQGRRSREIRGPSSGESAHPTRHSERNNTGRNRDGRSTTDSPNNRVYPDTREEEREKGQEIQVVGARTRRSKGQIQGIQGNGRGRLKQEST
ncbi:hypothetical protein F5Y17DRAFT_279742 [Xylariaceae sp. FL0594]|nr:hypothetical protein F5Y17DRAFT_279742 [Xylariaceae sp. FL0594]